MAFVGLEYHFKQKISNVLCQRLMKIYSTKSTTLCRVERIFLARDESTKITGQRLKLRAYPLLLKLYILRSHRSFQNAGLRVDLLSGNVYQRDILSWVGVPRELVRDVVRDGTSEVNRVFPWSGYALRADLVEEAALLV